MKRKVITDFREPLYWGEKVWVHIYIFWGNYLSRCSTNFVSKELALMDCSSGFGDPAQMIAGVGCTKSCLWVRVREISGVY